MKKEAGGKKDMTVENENSRQIKSEERLKHDEQTSFNYTLNGKTDEVGLIAKGSASNAGGNNELSEKKKKVRDENLKLLLEGNKDFKAFMDDFGDKLDDYNRVADRQSRRQAAFESGDWDQYRLILINDYDMNADDVAAMNNEDFQKLDPELQDLDEFTKETLKHELIQLAKDYDEEHGFTDEQKQALQELVDRSDIEGLDFDKVLSDTTVDVGIGFYDETNDVLISDALARSDENISEPFNTKHSGSISSVFNVFAGDEKIVAKMSKLNKLHKDPNVSIEEKEALLRELRDIQNDLKEAQEAIVSERANARESNNPFGETDNEKASPFDEASNVQNAPNPFG